MVFRSRNWRCSGCSEEMSPGEVAIFAERAGQETCWHPTCFSCWECGEVLEDLLYYYSQAGGREAIKEEENERKLLLIEKIFIKDFLIFLDEWDHTSYQL